MAEQCAWHVNSRNYRAAAKQMWELLAWNADTLPANPMERFRHPDEVGLLLAPESVQLGVFVCAGGCAINVIGASGE